MASNANPLPWPNIPHFAELPNEFSIDPPRQAQFTASLDGLVAVAEKVPLVHVARPGEGVDAAKWFERLIQGLPDHSLLPDPRAVDPTAQRSPKTEAAEEAFGWPATLYFFAGRALPGEGVVFVFKPTVRPSSGTCTPFDTGGMYHGFIHCDPFLAKEDKAERTRRVKDSNVPISSFHQAYAAFVAAFFLEVENLYRAHPPKYGDAWRMLLKNEGIYAKSWEVQTRQALAVSTEHLMWLGLKEDEETKARDAMIDSGSSRLMAYADRIVPSGSSAVSKIDEEILRFVAGG